jgi:hypothetical protein
MGKGKKQKEEGRKSLFAFLFNLAVRNFQTCYTHRLKAWWRQPVGDKDVHSVPAVLRRFGGHKRACVARPPAQMWVE